MLFIIESQIEKISERYGGGNDDYNKVKTALLVLEEKIRKIQETKSIDDEEINEFYRTAKESISASLDFTNTLLDAESIV